MMTPKPDFPRRADRHQNLRCASQNVDEKVTNDPKTAPNSFGSTTLKNKLFGINGLEQMISGSIR
jgi:hypothetical protein